jgi:hypothetical protein
MYVEVGCPRLHKGSLKQGDAMHATSIQLFLYARYSECMPVGNEAAFLSEVYLQIWIKICSFVSYLIFIALLPPESQNCHGTELM